MIDLDKLKMVAERAVKIDADKEQLFDANEVLAVLASLQQAEKDAARYRWLRDSADEFDINDFFMCSQIAETRDAFADEAMQCK